MRRAAPDTFRIRSAREKDSLPHFSHGTKVSLPSSRRCEPLRQLKAAKTASRLDAAVSARPNLRCALRQSARSELSSHQPHAMLCARRLLDAQSPVRERRLNRAYSSIGMP